MEITNSHPDIIQIIGRLCPNENPRSESTTGKLLNSECMKNIPLWIQNNLKIINKYLQVKNLENGLYTVIKLGMAIG